MKKILLIITLGIGTVVFAQNFKCNLQWNNKKIIIHKNFWKHPKLTWRDIIKENQIIINSSKQGKSKNKTQI